MHRVEGITVAEPALWRPIDESAEGVWVCDDHGVINLGPGRE